METRKLGNLEVTAIGMGCMGISHAAGTPMDENEAVRLIREAVDLGYTFFDTAKNYGYKDEPHHNEKILGKALSGIRNKVVIASKCGVDFDYSIDPDVPPLIYDSSREGIRKSVECSLRRLHTDYIDLYFQARIDPKIGAEEVADTMKELIAEGKILHWGISEVDAEYLKRANKVCPVTAVENVYNMINRKHEELTPVLEENKIGWVAHGPMFKGLLSGTFQKGTKFKRDDWRGRLINDDNLERYQALLIYLVGLGREKDATPGQLSLAWILQKKPYIVPIPGMRSKERLIENARASEIFLTPEEIKKIDELSSQANGM
ncbi:MAG TPA: aldo/keto reductase [Candidatus Blautia stercoravium]|nr:aldo/keto reductase [Candidatus Blautia stercoravium]